MKEFEELLRITEDKYSTCSLNNPKTNCVTFVKSEKYIESLKKLQHLNLIVLAPKIVVVPVNIDKNIKSTSFTL
jgi:hypothetical protein